MVWDVTSSSSSPTPSPARTGMKGDVPRKGHLLTHTPLHQREQCQGQGLATSELTRGDKKAPRKQHLLPKVGPRAGQGSRLCPAGIKARTGGQARACRALGAITTLC